MPISSRSTIVSMPKILLAGLFHETHCFVDDTTSLDQFTISRGQALLDFRGNGSTIDGFLEVADWCGWEIVPVCAYSATPSGTVEDEVVEAFWQELHAAALAEGFDAVFLSLHGAMVSRSFLDVEGTILERLRALPGMDKIPVFGVFDLHANLSRKMVELATCLVCYRENPHTDARAASVRAAMLLERALRRRELPRMYVRHAGIIWPPTGTGTADTPMKDLVQLSREIESANRHCWAVNVVAGFAYGDCPETGVAFCIAGSGTGFDPEPELGKLCQRAWELRIYGLPIEEDPRDVLANVAVKSRPGPVLLVEPSDNIGGGAPGDSTGVLRALLDFEQKNAAVIINDPQAVSRLEPMQPGTRTLLSIGGKCGPRDRGPVEIEVELISRSDGRFTVEDTRSHIVASTGYEVNMGNCAVVRHKGITLLLTSRKTPPFDLGQWRSQGLYPERFSVIGVKAAVAHRQAYDPIAAESYTVSTPGACPSDLSLLDYRHVPRSVFPLDQNRRE